MQFNYRSPEGVHDKKPLVYVVEVQADRVYGLNVHYDFKLMENIIANKRLEVSKLQPQQPSNNPLKDAVEEKKPTLTTKITEEYALTRNNKYILRCYLYPRMSNITKLVYKSE